MGVALDTRPAGRLLDRPVWAALSSEQAHLSVKAGHAVAFARSVAQFAAIDPDAAGNSEDLAGLAKGRPEGFVLFQAAPVSGGPRLRVAEALMGVQMVAARPIEVGHEQSITTLSPADISGILALVALTKPGPFKRQTLRTGRYIGIKENGHLIAMAGERMRLPGYTEISAVCTHPRYRGAGLAAALVGQIARGIRARGDIPFLHTYATNTSAIGLYERLGFELRQDMHIVRLVANQ